MVARSAFLFGLLLTLGATSALSPEPPIKKEVAPSAGDPDTVAIQGVSAMPGGLVAPVSSIAVSHDGRHAFVPSPDGLQLLRINTNNGKVSHTVRLSTSLTCIKASPNGALIAAVCVRGNTVTLFDARNLSQLVVLVTASGPRTATFSADGTRLFVACGASNTLQVFDVASAQLIQATLLPGSPSALSFLNDGVRIAVALFDSTQVRLLDASHLSEVGSISVPAGPSALLSHVQDGKNLLVVASALTDLICVIDEDTLDILKTIRSSNPLQAEGNWNLAGLALISSERRFDAIPTSPVSPDFGELRVRVFPGSAIEAFAISASGACVVQSADHLALVHVEPNAIINAPYTESLTPSRGLPGSFATARGRFGRDTSALLTREEVLESVAQSSNNTSSSLDFEIPLESQPGRVEIWASDSSPRAIASGSFLGATPAVFDVVGSLEALEELIGEIEAALRDATLLQAARHALEAALDSLRNASALLGQGNCGPALDALKAASNSMGRARDAGAPVGSMPGAIARIIQFTVFAKLRPVRAILGSNDGDVRRAQNSFDAARGILRGGNLDGAIDRYLASFEYVEDAIVKARRLTAVQAVVILDSAMSDLFRLRGRVHSRILSHDDRGVSRLVAAFDEIGPFGQPESTCLGNLSKLDIRKALANLRNAVRELGVAAPPAVDLQSSAFWTARRMVAAIADAVDHNIGPFDAAVVRARRYLAECAERFSSNDVMGALSSLEQALGDALPATSQSSSMELFQATGTDTSFCRPRVQVKETDDLCIDPVDGIINPNPHRTKVLVTSNPSGATGELHSWIARAGSGEVVKDFGTLIITTPREEIYHWDGRDNAGNIVDLKGNTKQEFFVFVSEFICITSDGHRVPAIDGKHFTVTEHGGLVVKPSTANKCASTPEQTVTQQFRAYKCEDGAVLEEVTAQCHWSLDNAEVGSIGANTGLFTAAINGRGKAKVTAVLLGTECRGEARVTVTPESGGIVEPSVELCVNGTYDFDAHKECDAEGNSVAQDDQDFQWAVSDPAKGSINNNGFFRALATGTVSITATAQDGTVYTATAIIGGVDDIAIIRAPSRMCAFDEDPQVFQVQVFCNGQPEAGVTVNFSSGAAVTVNPASAVTDAAGMATTLVAPTGVVPPAPGIVFLFARAEAVSATTVMLVEGPTIQIVQAPTVACASDPTPQPFSVSVTCGGNPVVGRTVAFSSTGEVNMVPASAATDGAGIAATTVVTKGIPSAALNSTRLFASMDGTQATSSMTVFSITASPPNPAALCADGVDTVVVTAEVRPSGGTVDWSVGGGASITNVTQTGGISRATVKAGNAGGQVTVRATVREMSSCFDEVDLDLVKISAIAFDVPALCADGFDFGRATATIVPGERRIRWSISARIGAAGTAINPDTGVITAGLDGGIINVRAADSELADCFTEAPLDIVKVTITAFPAEVLAGSTSTLTAQITPPDRQVFWSIAGGDPTGSTINPVPFSNNATLTAGFSPGTIIIRAEDTQLPHCFDQVFIQVLPRPPTQVEIDLDIAGVPDNLEDSTGGTVCLNNDDDDKNGTPDIFERRVTGENDLVELTLAFTSPPTALGFVTVEIAEGSGVLLWNAPDKRGGPSTILVFDPFRLPVRFYAEGVALGASVRLRASYEDLLGLPKSQDHVRLHVAGIEFTTTKEPVGDRISTLRTLNPHPVVELSLPASPGGGQTATLNLEGITRDAIAPIEFVRVNGKRVAVTTTSRGPKEVGPFEGRFSAQVELTSEEIVIEVAAMNAVSGLGAARLKVTPVWAEPAQIVDRTVTRAGGFSPGSHFMDGKLQPPSQELNGFKILVADPSLSGDATSVTLDSKVAQRTVSLRRIPGTRLFTSKALLAIPNVLTGPLQGEVHQARLPVEFGKTATASYQSGSLTCEASAVVTGVLLLGEGENGQKDQPMFQVYTSIEADLGLEGTPADTRNALTLIAGYPGTSGRKIFVTLNSFGRTGDLTTVPNFPNALKITQAVPLFRQSNDHRDPDYNLYKMSAPSDPPAEPVILLTVPLPHRSAQPPFKLHGAQAGGVITATGPDGLQNSEFVAGIAALDKDGNEVDEQPASDPRPVVKLEPVTDLSLQVDNIVEFTIQGEVTDAIADIVEENLADITSVRIHGTLDPALTAEVTRIDVPTTRFRPYAFKGRFTARVTAKVGEGRNLIVVEAVNALDNPGWAAIAVPAEISIATAALNQALSDPPAPKFFNGDRMPVQVRLSTPEVVDGPVGEGTHHPLEFHIFDHRITEESLGSQRLVINDQEFALKFGGSVISDKLIEAAVKKLKENLRERVKNVMTIVKDPLGIQELKANYERMKAIVVDWVTQGKKRARGTQSTVIAARNLRPGVLVELRVVFAGTTQEDSEIKLLRPDAPLTGSNGGFYKVNDKGEVRVTMDISKDARVGGRNFESTRSIKASRVFVSEIDVVPLKTIVLAIDGVGRAAFDGAVATSLAAAPPDIEIKRILESTYNIISDTIKKQLDIGDGPPGRSFFNDVKALVSPLPAGGLGKVFGDANKTRSRDARNFFPTVTWTNWASIFTGTAPVDHGITGLTFFPRETAALQPVWSAGGMINGMFDIRNISDTADFVGMATLGILNDRDFLNVNAKTLYESSGLGEKKQVSILNMVNRGATNLSAPGIAWKVLIGASYLMLPETSVDGLIRDSSAGWAALTQLTKKEIPDLMTVYLPGPDTAGHGEGSALPRQFLEEVTDRIFTACILSLLEFRGWDTATLFALTSDHGMSEVNPALDHVVALHDNDNTRDDVDELLKKQPLGLQVWGSPSINPGDLPANLHAVYSPNGGMAHVYLRGTGDSWQQASNMPLVRQVATQFVRANVADKDPATPEVDFQRDLRNRIRTVLFRERSNFGSGYKVRVRTDSGLYGDQDLSTLPASWNLPVRLDKELAGSRSGDVILVMYDDEEPVGGRSIAWNSDKTHYKGWHGSAGLNDSRVPLVFGWPAGGNLRFLDQAINAAKPVGQGGPTNADLTPILLEILKRRQ